MEGRGKATKHNKIFPPPARLRRVEERKAGFDEGVVAAEDLHIPLPAVLHQPPHRPHHLQSQGEGSARGDWKVPLCPWIVGGGSNRRIIFIVGSPRGRRAARSGFR